MKSVLNYLVELQNVTMGIFPFVLSIFGQKPLIEPSVEEKIKNAKDKSLFYETIENLKKNGKEKETITLTTGEKLTIIVK